MTCHFSAQDKSRTHKTTALNRIHMPILLLRHNRNLLSDRVALSFPAPIAVVLLLDELIPITFGIIFCATDRTTT